MKKIEEIIKNKALKFNTTTVNSKYKSLSTVNSGTVSQKIDDFIDKLGITPEGIAQKLSEDLDDLESFDYYLILAKENPTGKLLEASSLTKDAARKGKIKTKKAIYFQGILRKLGLKTKFKNS